MKSRGATSPVSLNRRATGKTLLGWPGFGAPTARPRDPARPAGPRLHYLDEDGEPVEEPEVLERIRALGIPPAWKEVWICPWPERAHPGHGHRRRRAQQYLYHATGASGATARSSTRCSTSRKDAAGAARARRPTTSSGEELDRERVLACALRLLDRGFFRIGTEEYAAANESYGLATMRKAHVTLEDETRWSSTTRPSPASGGSARSSTRDVLEVVAPLKRRRGGSDELLAYKDGRRWRDVRSDDINST